MAVRAPQKPIEVSVGYLPGQGRLLQEAAAHILFVAGVAAGKTEGGVRWLLKKICTEPGAVGFIGAQTHAQLTRISLPPLLRLISDCCLMWTYGKAPDWTRLTRFPKHDGILSICIPGTDMPCQIVTGSMENYNAHRGLSIGWYWLDEARDMAEEAYDVILSRLRGQPEGTNYGGILTTTPNGFGWLHRRFVAERVADSAVIRAATTENPFLPKGFVANLRAQYTERFAKQELDGEFLNLTSGQAYYAFRRDKHVSPVKLDPNTPLWYSMDFNVSPLCAGYGQATKSSCLVAGEIYIEGSGRTADAVEETCRRLEAHPVKSVAVYGDMSGANRDTRSDLTDYTIIKRTFEANGWHVEVHRNYTNPPLLSSVEAVCSLMEHDRLAIDPAAKHLIQDLEQVAWEEGSRVLDKSNPILTHSSDWLRYLVAKLYPLPTRKAEVSHLKL